MSQQKNVIRGVTWVYYVLSTLQFCAYYVMVCHPYLKLANYLSYTERNPFQQRILPVFLLRPLVTWPSFLSMFRHLGGVFMPAQRGAYLLLSLIGVLTATYFTQKLYESVVGERNRFWILVQPTLLYTVLWAYTVRTQSLYYYPYDMLSLGFFAAGLYAVYARRFVLLTLVMLIGTFNRETTLFLIFFYVIDACVVPEREYRERLRDRLDLRAIPWIKAGLLFVIWAAIKVALAHRFAANNNSEDFFRVGYNLKGMVPRQWPTLASICGFTIPILLLFRRKLAEHRFAAYLLIVPIWVAVMMMKGVIYEVRIYGELCPYAAVATVLLLRRYLAAENKQSVADAYDDASFGEEEHQRELAA